MSRIRFFAEPAALDIALDRSALVIIDMQRDFLEPGGFGEALGNDVSKLQAAVGPCKDVLGKARELGMLVIHTREGHRPDLTDAPPHKVERGDPSTRIGAPGPMGRILVRGEPGHDIIPELYPAKGEPVIDKPGKGAFYQTDLDLMLRNRGIDTLMVCGVTTEVCVNTTVREANDRGYRCIVLSDRCASVLPALSRDGARDDQGAGRHLRICDVIAGAALRARHGGVSSPRTLLHGSLLAEFSSTARPSPSPALAGEGRGGFVARTSAATSGAASECDPTSQGPRMLRRSAHAGYAGTPPRSGLSPPALLVGGELESGKARTRRPHHRRVLCETAAAPSPTLPRKSGRGSANLPHTEIHSSGDQPIPSRSRISCTDFAHEMIEI